jgi:hypothetical protein
MVAASAALKNSTSFEEQTPHPDFYPSMKRLTLTGYFTSEVALKQELHFKIIPGHYDGCVPAEALKQGK